MSNTYWLHRSYLKQIQNPSDLFPELTDWDIEFDDDGPDDGLSITEVEEGLWIEATDVENGKYLSRVVTPDDKIHYILAAQIEETQCLNRSIKIRLTYDATLCMWKDYTGWRTPADEFVDYRYDPETDRHTEVGSGHSSGAPYQDVSNCWIGEYPLEWEPGLPGYDYEGFNQRFKGHPEISGDVVDSPGEYYYPE